MRLVTRADFDGICCAVLLRELGIIGPIHYSNAADIQTGKVPVDSNDVMANVPYVEGCGLWFDHHLSEKERLGLKGGFEGLSATAPSAARVIYDFYDGTERLGRFEQMMKYVDIVDSASFSEEDVLNPAGWILLGFLCDPRSGLERVNGFSIPNDRLMHILVDHMLTLDIHEILALPEIRERVEMYHQMDAFHRDFLKSYSTVDGPVVITDTRSFEEVPPGNRFLIYSLFPETNISLRLIEDDDGMVTISVGHSTLNRSSKVNVGPMLLKYGGGGHARVGTCRAKPDEADKVVKRIVSEIKAAG